jgi:hypothetical protein
MIGGEDNLSTVFDGNNWYSWSRDVKGYFLYKDLSTFDWEPNGRPGTMPEEGWPEGEVRGKGLLVRCVGPEYKQMVISAESLQHAWFAIRERAMECSRAQRLHLREALNSVSWAAMNQ